MVLLNYLSRRLRGLFCGEVLLEVMSMKKSMIVALGLMAGTVSAQDGVVMVDQGAVYSEAMTEATLEVALASSYV